jgi:hypothetical protein
MLVQVQYPSPVRPSHTRQDQIQMSIQPSVNDVVQAHGSQNRDQGMGAGRVDRERSNVTKFDRSAHPVAG